MYGIEELIALAAEKRASDVHLIAGLPPKCRIDGRIETLTDGGLTREDCEEYGRQLAGNAADQIEAIGQLDFSASFAGRRLRVNLFRQQAALSAAIRLLSSTIPNLSELGLPEAPAPTGSESYCSEDGSPQRARPAAGTDSHGDAVPQTKH